ncbi:hypothetical protein LDENG_00226700, partial [Lucifuga dentata]
YIYQLNTYIDINKDLQINISIVSEQPYIHIQFNIIYRPICLIINIYNTYIHKNNYNKKNKNKKAQPKRTKYTFTIPYYYIFQAVFFLYIFLN